MKVKKIVLATDFSEASLGALETALGLALESGATLYLIHVLEFPPSADLEAVEVEGLVDKMYREDQQRLQGLIPKGRKKGLKTEVAVLRGTPAKKIAEFALKKAADMIVVGTHGRKGLARVFLGSTAEQLLRRAPCQVLVVKPKVAAADRRRRGSLTAATPPA
ncbi:MAG: universal stress protein [Acidobacteria bacterium]|nr:universal stress protein [Acidobacteriota bacterium]